MKFCEKCGKEIAENSSACLNCGCEVVVVEESQVMDKKPEGKSRKKIVLLLIIAAVSAIALLVAGYFVYNNIRTKQVIDDLSGQNYIYTDIKSYPALGEIHYTSKEMDFDDEGVLEYSYYYSNIDAGDEYQREYKIKFKGDMIILEMGIDEYEVMYDRYGQISGIYDFVYDELYE